MRYWVYINDKVVGPYDENSLATLDGFSPETLICAEETEHGGSQEWIKASSVFEFNESTKVMEPTVPPENGQGASATQDQPTSQSTSADTQLLLEKIDNLTQQIQSMQGKLDEALAAAAAQLSATQQLTQNPPQETTEQPKSKQADWEAPIVEDGLITNTESLLHHADEMVSQQTETQKQEEEKPIDFLDEIQIGETSTDETAEKGGEEVVLRSALDSLYNAKIQTEEEKESTFQDLLSPFKKPAVAAAAGAAVGAGVGAAMAASSEEKHAENAPVAEPEPVATEEAVTAEKREEIIDEITTPAPQEDLIAKAIAETKKEQSVSEKPEQQQQPQQEAELSILDLDAQPETQEEKPAEKEPTEDFNLQLNELPEELSAESKEERPSIDLGYNDPQVSNSAENPVAQEKEIPALATEPVEQVESADSAASQEAMPQQLPADLNEFQENDQTIKELVPGKKLEDEQSDGIISQADLDAAFEERPADNNEFLQTQAQVPPSQEKDTKEAYDLKDMTEVQLSAGSTYLISDFIPPGETGNAPQPAVVAEEPKEETKPLESNSAVEEMIPQEMVSAPKEEKASQEEKPAEDLSVSKIILENESIQTKRGATMDIKTVPMVQEPADSERLNLMDSDLDINAQHDLKAADFQQSRSGASKIVLGTLVSFVFLALIYIMLAYLGLIPAQFNMFKASQPVDDTAALTEMTDEQAAATEPFQLPEDIASQLDTQAVEAQGEEDEAAAVLEHVKNYTLANGKTLQEVINAKHSNQQSMIEWSITTAVEPDNYSILVKVPPENPQSFKVSYRFNFNTVTNVLEPTISDSKNLLDSIKGK